MPDRLSERLARVRSRRQAPTVRMDPVTVTAVRQDPEEDFADVTAGSSSTKPAPGRMDRLHQRLLEISRATTGSKPFGVLTPKRVTAAPTDAPDNVSAGELLTGAGTGAVDLAGRVAAALERGGNPMLEQVGIQPEAPSRSLSDLITGEEPGPKRVIPGIRKKLLGSMPEPATPGAAVTRGVGHAAGFTAPFLAGGGLPSLVVGSGMNALSEVGSEPEESMAGMLEKAGVLPEGASESGLGRAGVALAGDVATLGLLKGAGKAIGAARAARARPIEAPSPARQVIERAKASIAARKARLEAAGVERPPEISTPTAKKGVTRDEIFTPENRTRFAELSSKPVPKADQELRARVAAGEDLTDAEVHAAEPEFRTIYDALEIPHPAKPGTTIGAEVKRQRIRTGASDVPIRPREEAVDLEQALAGLEKTRASSGGAEFGDVSDVIEGLKRDSKRGPLTAGRVRARIGKAIIDHGKADAKAHGIELRNEGVVTIIAGPPGSGKSTIANQLGKENGSYVIDSDPAKLRDPRYTDIGASGVHNESAAVADHVMELALRRRENVIIPTVGKSEEKLRGWMQQLKARGLTVHYVLADLHPEEASVRAFNRGLSKGRTVHPDYVLNTVGNRPAETFDKLKLVTDITGGRYARLDQSRTPDVPLNARLTEHGPGFDPKLLIERGRGSEGLDRARVDRRLAQRRGESQPAPGRRSLRRLARETQAAQESSGAAGEVKPAPAGATKHEFSSTQLNLPDEASAEVKKLGAKIPEADLAADGREATPHVTVKYGLHGEDPEAVRKLLADQGPITVKLGKTSFFPNGESGNGDVLKVDVDSPELHAVNKKIADALPNTDTHPEYKPHATVAYLKPGLGKKYAGDASLEGQTITIDRLTFSSKSGEVTEIPLKGSAKAPAAPASRSKLSGLEGEEDVVTIGDRRLKVRHRVVEARDLVPSNNPANSFERDARYPKEIQGRVYSGEAGRGARERVVEMAGKMEPAGLTLPSRSVHGSPIVTEKGHAIVGNQRVMAWQMTEQNPVVAARLKAQVVKDAAKLGIDPAEVERMQHPMVVRELVDPTVSADDYDQLAKLNQLSDVSTGKAKDPRVEAAGRARQMARSPAALDHFADTISPDETINEYLRGKRGPELLDRLVKSEVIRPSELDQFRDASSGKLTKYGRERIQEMIQGAAVGGDPAVLDRAPEAILSKLDQSWPRAVKAEGTDGWSLEDPLKDALNLHGQKVDNGASSIDDVVGQADMFGREAKAASKGVTLAKFLEDHKKAEVTAAFQEYATAAEGAKSAGAADDMFGHKPETSTAAFKRIFGGPEEKPPKVAGTINYHDETARARENIHESVGGFSRKRRTGAIGSVAGTAAEDPHNVAAAKMLASIAGGGIGAAGGAAAPGTPEEKKARAALGLAVGLTAPFAPEIVEQLATRIRGAAAETPAKIFRIRHSAEEGIRVTIQGAPDKAQLEKLLALYNNKPGSKFGFSIRDLQGREVGKGDSIIQLYADLPWSESNAARPPVRHGAAGNQPDMFGHVEKPPAADDMFGDATIGKAGPAKGATFDKRAAEAKERGEFLMKQLKRMPDGPARARVAREVADLSKIANFGEKIGRDEIRARSIAGDDLFARAGAVGNQPGKGKVVYKPDESYISDKMPFASLRFDTPEGEVIALIDDVQGTRGHVEYIGFSDRIDDGGAMRIKQADENKIGPGAMREIFREINRQLPHVDELDGMRVGGARARRGDTESYATFRLGAGRGRAGAIGNQPRKTLPAPTPAVQSAFDEVAKGIDFSGRLAKGMKGTQRNLSSRIQKFSDAIANSNGPIERLGGLSESRPARNPRELLTFAKSSDATVKRAFEEGVLDPKTREIVGPSYNSIFEPVAGDDDALERALTYIVSKRMVGRGPSSTGGDKARFAAMQEVVKHGDADPILADVAERWGNYTNAIGEYAVKSKMWTPELWQRMKDSDVLYVRVKRLMDPAAAAPMGRSSKGFGNVGPGVDRFTGSARAMENPAEAMAEYTRQIIHRADRYAVGHAIFDAVDDMGPAGELIMSRIPSNSPAAKIAVAEGLKAQLPLAPADVLEEVSRMFDPKLSRLNPVLWRNAEDGGKEFGMVQAPELWSSIMQLNAQDQGAVRKFLDVTVRPLKRIFTATTTGWSPRFSLATNPSRDVPTALAQTQANLRPDQIARGYAEAIAALAGKSDIADEASRFGLTGVSVFAQDKPAVVARGFTRGARARHVARRVVAAPVTALEAAGTASDLGPRLGEYMAAQRKFAPKVASGEWTQWEANLRSSTLGRGVTLDFTNRPGNPVLKLFADYVPFFGVGLQAPTVAVKAAVRNPARYAAVMGAGGATAATVAWVLKHRVDEETRQQINDRSTTERSGFLYVPTTSGGPILKVPLGQESGIIVNTVTAALDKWMDDDPNAASLFMQTLARALPNGLDAAARGIIPIPGIQQIQENRANERVFGGRPVEPRRMEGLPAAERRYDTTAPTFDMLAAGARKIGFGAMDSPLKAENVVRGVTSQATPFITAATDPLASRVMGREGKKRIPLEALRHPLNPASAFVAAVPAGGTQSTEAFYDLKNELEQATNQKRAVYKAKDRAGAVRLRETYGELLQPGVKTVIDQADDRLVQLKDREAEIRGRHDRGELSDVDAREALKSVTTRRQVMLRRVVTVLRQHGVTP